MSRTGSLGEIFQKSFRTFLKPIVPFWDDPTVFAIFINSPDDIWVERTTGIKKIEVQLIEEQIHHAIRKISQFAGVLLSEENPHLSTELPDGSQVSILAPPLSQDFPILTIKKRQESHFPLEELVYQGVLSDEAAVFLRAALLARQSILLVGPPSSGKSELGRALMGILSEQERIVHIAKQNALPIEHNHALQCSFPVVNEDSESSMSDTKWCQAISSLSPNRLFLEDAPSTHILPSLYLLDSRFQGSILSFDGFGYRDALRRLESACLRKDPQASILSIRSLLTTAFQLVVFCCPISQMSSQIVEICELTSLDAKGEYQAVPLFQQTRLGGEGETRRSELLPAGNQPSFLDVLGYLGFEEFDSSFFGVQKSPHRLAFEEQEFTRNEATNPSSAALEAPKMPEPQQQDIQAPPPAPLPGKKAPFEDTTNQASMASLVGRESGLLEPIIQEEPEEQVDLDAHTESHFGELIEEEASLPDEVEETPWEEPPQEELSLKERRGQFPEHDPLEDTVKRGKIPRWKNVQDEPSPVHRPPTTDPSLVLDVSDMIMEEDKMGRKRVQRASEAKKQPPVQERYPQESIEDELPEYAFTEDVDDIPTMLSNPYVPESNVHNAVLPQAKKPPPPVAKKPPPPVVAKKSPPPPPVVKRGAKAGPPPPQLPPQANPSIGPVVVRRGGRTLPAANEHPLFSLEQNEATSIRKRAASPPKTPPPAAPPPAPIPGQQQRNTAAGPIPNHSSFQRGRSSAHYPSPAAATASRSSPAILHPSEIGEGRPIATEETLIKKRPVRKKR